MEDHPDLVLSLLGIVVLVCICLLFVILCLCCRHSRRLRKHPSYSKAEPRPGRLHYQPGSSEERRGRYSHIQDSSPTPQGRKEKDDVAGKSPSPSLLSRFTSNKQRKTPGIEMPVYTPLVTGEVLDGHLAPSSSPYNTQRGSLSDSSVRPKTSPDLSPHPAPPYATPLKSSRSTEDITSPDAQVSNDSYPDIQEVAKPQRGRSPYRAWPGKKSQHDNIARIRNIMINAQTAQRQRDTDLNDNESKIPTNMPTTDAVRGLPRHRCESPTSRQPIASTKSSKSVLENMNQLHFNKQRPGDGVENKLRPKNKVSQGELRRPSVAQSKLSTVQQVVAMEFARSRKRSNSLPNLSEQSERGISKDNVSKTVSTAAFNLVYTATSSRNPSPTLDYDCIGKHGAILFSIRYDAFSQAVVVSGMRCGGLPPTRFKSQPGVCIKCRIFAPYPSKKFTTKVVQDSSGDPSFKDETFTFAPYTQAEVRECHLLFKVKYVMALNHRRTIGQCTFQVSESPHVRSDTAIFRNLDPHTTRPAPKRRYS